MPVLISYRDASAPDAALIREAERLVTRAADSEVSQRAALLQPAADLFRKAGADARALRVMGELIDGLLECDRTDAAVAQCRRVIRLYPEVVRARCTLAFLLAYRGDVAEAGHEMERYVTAARHAGVADIAIQRLKLLAAHPVAERIREATTRALEALGGAQAEESPLELAPGVTLPTLLRADPEALATFIAEPVLLAGVRPVAELPWLDTSLPGAPDRR
jgi:hypothetical protein